MHKDNVGEIIKILSGLYPQARTALEYENAFQLLIAVILSAQSTDLQVNRITEKLFKKHRSPEDFARLNADTLADQIKSCGLFCRKSKNIISACRILVEKYGSCVPSSREELEKLPGVGPKSASVLLGIAFKQPTLPVDTHVFRISHRLGLSKAETPEKTEKELLALIPPQYRMDFHHQLLAHGRQVCTARKPKCIDCRLLKHCAAGNSFLSGKTDLF
jgi:endonuclease-3